MANVFLSYSHLDKEIANHIQADLQKAGHTVWRDVTAIPGGRPIPDEVATALTMADFLLVLVSANALQSRWMRNELSIFSADPERFLRVIPLRCDDTEITQFSPLLAPHKYIDLNATVYRTGMAALMLVLGPPDPTSHVYAVDDLPRLEFAIDLALQAGSVAMRFYNSSLTPNEPVATSKNPATRADQAAQEVIEAALLHHPVYRSDGFYGEEHSTRPREIRETGYTWVVDPLDGTTNFSARIPMFCIALGLLRDREPRIGVIYDPVANEVHFAVDGLPARTWNIPRGEVSQIRTNHEVQKLKEAVVATHISSRPDVAQRLIQQLPGVELGVKQIRALGCGQLALAYIASGRLQSFFQFSAKIWDQVAGIVLVKNAGGIVTDLATGDHWTPETEDLLVSANEAVHEQLCELLASAT